MAAGANFIKVDLHVHAPGIGQNYGLPAGESEPETSDEKMAFARRMVEHAHEVAGLSMIAITCHNDTSWVASLRRAARDMYGDEFVVLPGVEVGVEGALNSIHVLAIFPETTPVEIVERLLDDDLKLSPSERFDSSGNVMPSTKSFSDAVKAIKDRGGLAIAAHVFSGADSLLESKSNQGQSRRKQFLHEHLYGLDLAGYSLGQLKEKQSGWGYYLITNQHQDPAYRRPRPIGLLNTSDARRLEGIGQRFTYVKCERPSFQALKNALLDPEARLRLQSNPPTLPTQRIERLTVSHTSTGFLRGLDLPFNPRLNCLIGGRGTGKSAIIEVLRYLWDQKPLYPDEKTDEEMRSFVEVFFPESAEATLELTKEHARYRILRRGRDAPRIERQETDGTWLPCPNLHPRDLFHLDVYGQKEVLSASKNVRSQLDLLDRLIGGAVDRLKRERDNLLIELRRNREAIIALYDQIEQLNRRLEDKARIEEQLRQYQQAGLGEKAQQKRLYDREAQGWEIASRQLDEATQTLRDAQDQVRFKLDYLNDEELSPLPNRDSLAMLRARLEQLSSVLRNDLAQAQQHVTQARTDIKADQSEWEKKRDAFEDEYRMALRQLPGLTPDSVTRLERERMQLDLVERDVSRLRDEIHNLLEVRKELLRRLLDNGRQQFETRQHKANEISTSLSPRVRLRVTEGGDLEWIVEQLHRYLSGSKLREGDYQSIARAAIPSILPMLAAVEAADRDTPADLRVYQPWLSTTLSLLPEPSKAAKLIEYLSMPERLEFDEQQPSDRVTIELNIAREGEHENWRPLGRRLGEGVSVGQGCTAILSIILLESDRPLIIDQPEDDLDNRFIYDDVVQILRRERDRRQVLVATHNANIPVAGDAEFVVALDTQEETARDRTDLRCKIAASGFIDKDDLDYDNHDMKQMWWHVSQILEGGKTAFELRQQKYGF